MGRSQTQEGTWDIWGTGEGTRGHMRGHLKGHRRGHGGISWTEDFGKTQPKDNSTCVTILLYKSHHVKLFHSLIFFVWLYYAKKLYYSMIIYGNDPSD